MCNVTRVMLKRDINFIPSRITLNVNASSSAATRLQKRLHNQTNEEAPNLNKTRQNKVFSESTRFSKL